MNDEIKEFARQFADSRVGALLTIITIACIFAAGFYAGVQWHQVCP